MQTFKSKHELGDYFLRSIKTILVWKLFPSTLKLSLQVFALFRNV